MGGVFWNRGASESGPATTVPRYVPRAEQLKIGRAAEQTAEVLRGLAMATVLARLGHALARAQTGEEAGRGR